MIKLLKETPPPYQQLFRAIGQLEDGIKFLVDLRADVLVSASILSFPPNLIFSSHCRVGSEKVKLPSVLLKAKS